MGSAPAVEDTTSFLHLASLEAEIVTQADKGRKLSIVLPSLTYEPQQWTAWEGIYKVAVTGTLMLVAANRCLIGLMPSQLEGKHT